MIITRPGIDIITINDNNNNNTNKKSKTHIIRLDFEDPSFDQIDWVLKNYPLTNRFVINNNIKLYNQFFKTNNKKYYVENTLSSSIFSFFKKNNKILLNLNKLRYDTQQFILKDYIFRDVLNNLEIIEINKKQFEEKKDMLENWNGNVIIS